MYLRSIALLAFLFVGQCLIVSAAANEPAVEDLNSAIEKIKKVDKNGEGHEGAVEAMRVLNKATADQIPLILEGMDGANKLATNWLRSAVVSVSSRTEKLPTEKIKSYFDDTSNAHLGRLLAFDLLSEADAQFADATIPNLADDPSLPLRAKAIKRMLAEADTAEGSQAFSILVSALEKARDVNQVVAAAEKLDEKGVAINLQKQLGFLAEWQLAGNFDNAKGEGFDVVHGPEKNVEEVDLEAEYDSTDGKAKWQAHNTTDSLGLVDLNEVIGKVKGVSAYAYTTFRAEEEREAEIRIGCINAHKVWLNGKLIVNNNVNHNGISPDKFSGRGQLAKGDNNILVKVCQNEQTQPWAQRWQFQVRVCDETGKAIQPAKPKPSGN